MTRIGISAHFVRPGKVGGAEYMLYNLLEGFHKVLQPNDKLTVFCSAELEPKNRMTGFVWRASNHSYIRNRFVQESWMLLLQRKNLDCVLFPNYFTPPVPYKGRVVTTIHDLNYLHFPSNFTERKRAWLRISHNVTLRRADTVVTISDFTRGDILRCFGHGFADRIRVIPNPVSFARFAQDPINSCVECIPSQQQPFILSVASQYPHKNLETLIRAFQVVRKTHKDYCLVMVGQFANQLVGVAKRPNLQKLIDELGLSKAVQLTGHVSDAVLGSLYRHANLFIFPSLFEGFGLPVVEALGMGLPVLTTRCGSLPEVTRGQACYVDDPLNVKEMADHILEIIRDPKAFAPKTSIVRDIRHYYCPERIARDYYRTLVNCG